MIDRVPIRLSALILDLALLLAGTGLYGYWSWTHRNREVLAANNRTARAVSGMNRLRDLDALLEQESARETF